MEIEMELMPLFYKLKEQLDRIENNLFNSCNKRCYQCKDIFSEREALSLLDVTSSTLYTWKSRKRISYYKAADSNLSYFTRADLESFMKGRYFPANTTNNESKTTEHHSFVFVFVDENLDDIKSVLEQLLSHSSCKICYNKIEIENFIKNKNTEKSTTDPEEK
jgi:hypothetical protein